ncbi:unnamed protein product, partial [Amoebophrya sp. A120]|eukprot:GSA120T00009024001.1
MDRIVGAVENGGSCSSGEDPRAQLLEMWCRAPGEVGGLLFDDKTWENKDEETR